MDIFLHTEKLNIDKCPWHIHIIFTASEKMFFSLFMRTNLMSNFDKKDFLISLSGGLLLLR
jgi:hypothetical protein